MNNNERPAGTAVQTPTEAEVTPSSPTCCNNHVGGSTDIRNMLRRFCILLIWVFIILVLPYIVGRNNPIKFLEGFPYYFHGLIQLIIFAVLFATLFGFFRIIYKYIRYGIED